MPRGAWLVATGLVFATRVAMAESWSVAVRAGAHTESLTLPNYDGTNYEQRSGESGEVEVACEVMPRLALAAFVRVDHHADSLDTFTNEYVGLRARVFLRPFLFVGLGFDAIDEREDFIEDRRVSFGGEAEIGAVLIQTRRIGLELMLDAGRFSEGAPMFHGAVGWTRLSLGVRFR
jgi:hypothetical protein